MRLIFHARAALLVAAAVVSGCGARAAKTSAPARPASAAAQPDTAESFGSTRNARVAFPIPRGTPPGDRPRLTFLAAHVGADEIAALARVAPNVRIIDGLDQDSALAHAAEAHGADARLLTPELIARAPHL